MLHFQQIDSLGMHFRKNGSSWKMGRGDKSVTPPEGAKILVNGPARVGRVG